MTYYDMLLCLIIMKNIYSSVVVLVCITLFIIIRIIINLHRREEEEKKVRIIRREWCFLCCWATFSHGECSNAIIHHLNLVSALHFMAISQDPACQLTTLCRTTMTRTRFLTSIRHYQDSSIRRRLRDVRWFLRRHKPYVDEYLESDAYDDDEGEYKHVDVMD